MRLSLPAARSAAFKPLPCANRLHQASHPSTRPYRLLPDHARNTFPSNLRRYGVSPCLRAQHTKTLEAKDQESEGVDLAELRKLDLEVENDPKRKLRDQERTMRDAHRQRRFINLLRTVPNPVAIVTTQRQDVEDPSDEFLMGATVSSFKSVCVAPEPYISFNLSVHSRTYQTIKDHKYFCVTIPQNDNAGQRLAKTFTHRSPKDALKGQPGSGKVEKHRWNLALEGGMPPDMRHPPPAVKMSSVKGAKTNGIAFAFVCEFHDSMVVGDHVIITGKVLPASFASASPWGKDDDLGDVFASNDVTLCYVHGQYSNPELFGDIDQSWKADDPYLGESASEMEHARLLEALEFFEKRLQLIDDALGTRKNHEQSGPHLRARLIRRKRLFDYRQYYERRALECYSVEDVSIGKPHSSSQNSLDLVRTIMQLHNTSTLDELGDSASRTEAVLRESLLGNAQLKQEEKLYLARLEALKWSQRDGEALSKGQPEQIDPHQTEQSSIQDSENTGSDIITDSEKRSTSTISPEDVVGTPNRREQLISHFKDKLSVVRQALEMRAEALVQPAELKTNSASISPEEQKRATARFLGKKRKTPLADLLADYRRYQLQVTESRLARIQCMYQKDQYDENILRVLEERLTHFGQRLDLISQVISEMYEGLDQTQLSKASSQLESRSSGNKTELDSAAEYNQAEHRTKHKREGERDKSRFAAVRRFRPHSMEADNP